MPSTNHISALRGEKSLANFLGGLGTRGGGGKRRRKKKEGLWFRIPLCDDCDVWSWRRYHRHFITEAKTLLLIKLITQRGVGRKGGRSLNLCTERWQKDDTFPSPKPCKTCLISLVLGRRNVTSCNVKIQKPGLVSPFCVRLRRHSFVIQSVNRYL